MPHRYAIQVKKGRHEKPRHLARRALRAVMLALVDQALGTRQAGGVEVGGTRCELRERAVSSESAATSQCGYFAAFMPAGSPSPMPPVERTEAYTSNPVMHER